MISVISKIKSCEKAEKVNFKYYKNEACVFVTFSKRIESFIQKESLKRTLCMNIWENTILLFNLGWTVSSRKTV